MFTNQSERAFLPVRRNTRIISTLLSGLLLALSTIATANQHETVDYLGHSTALSVASGQIGITVPGQVELGEFLVAQIAFTGGSDVNISDVPDNWTLLVREDQGSGLSHAIYYQIVGNPGTIPAPGTAFQWIFDQDISAVGAITRYSGVDFNNPVQAVESRKGNSTAMISPGVEVDDVGAVVKLYSMGAIAQISTPSGFTLRYSVNNPDPVTIGLRDHQVNEAPTQTSNHVALGFADGNRPWVTHSIAVRARTGSLTDPFNSLISADPTEITADGSSTSTITVQARDSAGNNIGTGGDHVIIETDAGTLLGSVVDHDDGTYTQQLLSSTNAATATLTGTINGFDIGDSATVHFVSGNADAGSSSISAADSQLPADGTASTQITVQVRDAHGNAVSEPGHAITLSTSLGTLGATSGTTDTQGQFITALTAATTGGTALVSGTLGGDAIGNTASVEFVDITPPVDASQSTIVADDDTLVANGVDSTSVTVQIRDSDGNPIAREGVGITLSAELGTLEETSGETNADGQFITTLTAPTDTGTDLISGRVLGEDIGNTAQVEYVAGPATRLRFAEQPTDARAGHPFSAAVEIVDANGNRVASASNTIDIQLTQANGAVLSGTLSVAALEGLATFGDLSVDLAGDYTLTASSTALTATVSEPFHISGGDASGDDSTITADPDEIIADGTSTSTITVQAIDEFGNVVSEPGLSVTLSTTAGTLTDTSGSTDANGQFSTILTSATSIGTATVSGTLQGESIGHAAAVSFVAGAVDAGTSTIEADDDELEADGETSTAVTVQARDANGLPVAEAGLAVTLTTTLGSLIDTEGVTDESGQFVTTLVSEPIIGLAEITGTLDGNAIGNSASVLFIEVLGETPELALTFEIQPATSVEAVPIRGPVTVGFVDEFGDPVIDHDGEIQIEILDGPVGASLGGTTVRMSEDGFVVFHDIMLDMIGEYRLRATSPDAAAADSDPFHVREDRMMHDRFQVND
jgi:hypothetical protein